MDDFTRTLNDDYSRRFMKSYRVVPLIYGYQIKNNRVQIIKNRINGNFELIHIYEGRLNITLDGRQVLCKGGDTLLIPPFSVHSFGPYSVIPYKNTFIHFDVEPFYNQDEFIRLFMGDESALHLSYNDALDDLFKGFDRESCFADIQHHLISSLLALLDRSGGRPKNISRGISGEHRKIDDAMSYVKNNMERDISLNELASYLSVSLSGLHKMFVRAFGDSPASVIRTMKIRRAEQLLKTTELSIKEISYRTGFASNLYFSKVFRRFFARSPREYREMNRHRE